MNIWHRPPGKVLITPINLFVIDETRERILRSIQSDELEKNKKIISFGKISVTQRRFTNKGGHVGFYPGNERNASGSTV